MIEAVRRSQDGALALAVAIGGVVPAAAADHAAVGIAVSLVAAAAVGLRNRHPLPALLVVLIAATAVTAADVLTAFTPGIVIADAVLLYTVGAASDIGSAAAGLVGALAAYWTQDALLSHRAAEYAVGAVLAVVPWVVGRFVRRERRLRSQLDAARVGQREAVARAAVADERRRITRDVLDVVAHALSAIAVQSAAADAAFTVDPHRARTPILKILAVARRSLDEMRQLLTMVRADPAGRPQFDLAPARRPSSGTWISRGVPAAAVLAIGWAAVLGQSRDVAAGCVVVVLVAGAVGLRAREPVIALGLVVALAIGTAALRPDAALSSAYVTGAVVLLFTGGALAPRRAAVALALGLLGFWGVDALRAHSASGYVASATLVLGAWLVGLVWAYERRLRVQLDAAHAAERQALAAAAAADERRHIARELHDLVAHGLSAIAVQADAADAVLERDPSRARTAVRSVAAHTEQAGAELRQLLAALDVAGSAATLDDDLNAVLDTQAELGLTLVADLGDDALSECPPITRYTTMRIVQEALTNVRRHSAAGSATVRITRSDGELRITVLDPGPVRDVDRGPAGHGTTGIRERVELLGGRCTLGPRATGWCVDARLPLPSSVPAGQPS